MSNLSDFLTELFGDDAKSLNAAGALIGIAADASGAVTTIEAFVQFFTKTLDPTNQQILDALTSLTTEVQAGINQVETQVAMQSLLTKMGQVDQVMDGANGVFASLPDEVPKLPNDVIVQNLITPSLTALIALRDDNAKWTVPWSSPVAYTDGWSGNLWPPHNDLVFSYIYTLPQFLHAIGIFLTVAAAVQPFQPTVLADHTQDLILCINKLQNVLDTITAPTGLVGTKMPQEHDVAAVGIRGNLEIWEVNWWDWDQGDPSGGQPPPGDPRLWPFGAVETTSGVSLVDSYWPFLPDKIAPESIPDGFFNLLALRIENRKKELFAQLALPSIRNTIIKLQEITGQPIIGSLPYETWSFRNALNILGITLNGSGALQALRKFLGSVPPYSGGFLFPLEAGDKFPPSQTPKSFRSIFLPN